MTIRLTPAERANLEKFWNIHRFTVAQGKPSGHNSTDHTPSEHPSTRSAIPTPQRNGARGGICALVLVALILCAIFWIVVGVGIAGLAWH